MKKLIIGILAVLVWQAGHIHAQASSLEHDRNERASSSAIVVAKAEKAAQTRSVASRSGNLGVFHFNVRSNGASVDPLIEPVAGIGELNATYARVAISWGVFEPQMGKFSWDNEEARLIDAYLAKGIKVVPSIRARSDWAVKYPDVRITSAPKDMRRDFDERYGHSQAYYDFIKRIAEHYKGKFEIVAIENEVHDEDKWRGTMDEYLWLLATARKAYTEVDPGAKIADGGIQGGTWAILVMNDFLRRGMKDRASVILRETGPDFDRAWKLDKIVSKKMNQPSQRNAVYLLQNGMDRYIDVFNFHHYQPASTLPDVLAYMRSQTNKPLMSNEIGSRFKSGGSVDKSAKEMIKKFAILLAHDVKPAIWFSLPAKRGNHTGSFVDTAQSPSQVTIRAYQAVVRFLDRPIVSAEDLSSGEMAKFRFSLGSEKVDVVWADGGTQSMSVPQGCKAYDFQGSPINSSSVSLGEAPIFVVCGP